MDRHGAGTGSVRAGPFGSLGAPLTTTGRKDRLHRLHRRRRANAPEQLWTLRAEPSVSAGGGPYAAQSKFVRDEHGCDPIVNPFPIGVSRRIRAAQVGGRLSALAAISD